MPHVGHYQTPVGPEKIVVLEVGRQIDVGFRSGRGLDAQVYITDKFNEFVRDCGIVF